MRSVTAMMMIAATFIAGCQYMPFSNHARLNTYSQGSWTDGISTRVLRVDEIKVAEETTSLTLAAGSHELEYQCVLFYSNATYKQTFKERIEVQTGQRYTIKAKEKDATSCQAWIEES